MHDATPDTREELLAEPMSDSELRVLLERLGHAEFDASPQATVGAVVEATGADPALIARLLGEIRQEAFEERFEETFGRHEATLEEHGGRIEVLERVRVGETLCDEDQAIVADLIEQERSRRKALPIGIAIVLLGMVLIFAASLPRTNAAHDSLLRAYIPTPSSTRVTSPLVETAPPRNPAPPKPDRVRDTSVASLSNQTSVRLLRVVFIPPVGPSSKPSPRVEWGPDGKRLAPVAGEVWNHLPKSGPPPNGIVYLVLELTDSRSLASLKGIYEPRKPAGGTIQLQEFDGRKFVLWRASPASIAELEGSGIELVQFWPKGMDRFVWTRGSSLPYTRRTMWPLVLADVRRHGSGPTLVVATTSGQDSLPSLIAKCLVRDESGAEFTPVRSSESIEKDVRTTRFVFDVAPDRAANVDCEVRPSAVGRLGDIPNVPGELSDLLRRDRQRPASGAGSPSNATSGQSPKS